MSARLRRTGRSFAAVFAAFWIYRLLLAPWIDPSFVLEDQPAADGADIARVRQADAQRLRKYQRIFPPGSWELDQPIMLESEGVELLMKDYENLTGGRIKLSQCTILYISNGDDGQEDGGRVVVLRAPQGAILQFDADLNLRRGKVGKLIGGHLKGPVTIHGTPTRPGADDELFIATRDVQMHEREVRSQSVVDFRYGPNHGKGRELVIHLLPGGGTDQRRGPNVGGFESVEVLRDVEMHLQPGSMGLFPGDEDNSSAIVPLPDPQTGHLADQELPVDIRCQGPFRFDLISRVASFENQVDVYRALREGVFDQMTCEVLQIFFGDKPAAGPTSPAAAGTRLSLQPERLLATGNPVVVEAPSNGLSVRANELEYEIARRRVRIEAAPKQPEARLTWNDAKFDSKFGGRSLVVERADPRRLPVVLAAGEGWLRIAEPADAARVLQANWSRELNMRPVEGTHRISMVGDAHANFVEFGDLWASEIQLWLVEFGRPAAQAIANTGAATRQYPVTPQRMIAQGSVRFDAPQLSGDTERLDVLFDPAGTLLPTPAKRSSSSALLPGGGLVGSNRNPQQRTSESAFVEPTTAGNQPLNRYRVAGAGDNSATQRANSGVSAVPQSQQHFELHANSIAVQLVSEGELTQLNHATLNGRVHLLEARTQMPADRPVEVRGDWLDVKNAALPRQTTMVVKGKPALVAASGMEMQGAQVNLDRSRNLLWIDGVGRTVLPPSRTAGSGNALPTARGQQGFAALDSLSDAPVTIDFAGGMNFDGRIARYNKQVKVFSESHAVNADQVNALEIRRSVLETDAVEVTLRRPVDFAAEQAAEDAEVADIACLGPVRMTQETSNNKGPIAVETLTAHDLTIQQATGDLNAFGPGWLETTRLGSATPLAPRSAAKPAVALAPSSEGLVYVRVDYQGKITGNVQRKELVFHDDIRGVYGPITRWGEKLDVNATQIGKQEIRFRSDELHVRQVAGVQPDTTAVELEAVGNTDVDGQAFSARAHRLTYVQGKEQLIFEGNGRSAAELDHQPLTGGSRNHARAGKLEYWLETGQVNVRDAQFFDLGQMGRDTPTPPSATRSVAN
ncbi:MAG: hypothetical protein WD894_00625 [Pirellulales bacterium]